MNRYFSKTFLTSLSSTIFVSAASIVPMFSQEGTKVMTVLGENHLDGNEIWLSHEHILVDFEGADHGPLPHWVLNDVETATLPYLNEIKNYGVQVFVDATPNFLGRDVALLKSLSIKSGLSIITNTGLYGAVENKYIPDFVYKENASELAEKWISEFEHGIHPSGVRPGFIKISVDNQESLEEIDCKLVRAAALTHLKTGLVIASHTGASKAVWPQLEILEGLGVSPSAFIWVHAQQEEDLRQFERAAEKGCWISFDGLGWETDKHVDCLSFAKANGFLHHVLISHDAGWFDPHKDKQDIRSYSRLNKIFLPMLREKGFTQADIDMLIKENPLKAFGIKIRTLD